MGRGVEQVEAGEAPLQEPLVPAAGALHGAEQGAEERPRVGLGGQRPAAEGDLQTTRPAPAPAPTPG